MEKPVIDQKTKYKNTRRMAWFSLLAAFAYIPLMMWKPSISSNFGAFLTFCGAVITAYMTNANVRDGWGKQ